MVASPPAARVLCLHGLGGTGATMWPLVGHLGAAGHQVVAPTLPGHGSAPADLGDVTWRDWLDAAEAWPADVVVGQSMGAALALALAARGRCRAVVAINPLATDPDALEGLAWRRSRGVEWVDVAVEPGEAAYDRLPLAALEEMHRGIAACDLAAVCVPVLVVTGALDDQVDPRASDAVASGLGGPVERLRLARTGHVATLGPERDPLGRAVVAFVDRSLAGPSSAGAGPA